MKLLTGFIAVFSVSALAQTVILYDDGSQYTVKENEKVYVSDYSQLYHMKRYSDGDVMLNRLVPSDKRDYVYVEPAGDGQVGSLQWCESYVPWSEGLTFDMIAWQTACDVNDDGEYNICDYYEPTGISTFEEMEWQDTCNNGEPWDGS